MFSSTITCIFKKIVPVNLFVILSTIGMVCITPSLVAFECSTSSSINESDQKLGRKLVNQYWNDVKHQDVQSYANKISKHFHGISIQGIYDKCQQVNGLENLTVTSFRLENLVAVRYCNTLEISYNFHAEGEGIVSGPSIDIWHKKGEKWKLISHTYVPFLDL